MADDVDVSQLIARAASMLTIWGVGKILGTEQGEQVVEEFDDQMQRARIIAQLKMREVGRNMRRHPGLLVIGAGCLIGAGVCFTLAMKK
ncbi:MAG: hypothetical protein WBX15_16230 [Thermoanaerobaculia bacterium]